MSTILKTLRSIYEVFAILCVVIVMGGFGTFLYVAYTEYGHRFNVIQAINIATGSDKGAAVFGGILWIFGCCFIAQNLKATKAKA